MKKRIQFTFHPLDSEDQYRGEFTLGISVSGRVVVELLKLSINDGDFREIAFLVEKFLMQRVVRELSQDIEAFRYTSLIDVYELREEEESEKMV